MYLIREIESSLVEGYYVDMWWAEDRLKRLQRKFKDKVFTIDFEEQFVKLEDSDLIRYSDWYNRGKNA